MIRIFENKKQYTDFLLTCERFNFLQSYEWGEFQTNIGNKVHRFGYYENNELAGITTLVIEKTKLCKFGVLQCGPILKQIDPQKYINFIDELTQYCKKDKIDILRIGSLILENESKEYISKLHEKKFVDATWQVFADYTSILDISKSEEDILKDMRKTTRYLVRQKEKYNIEVEFSNKEEDIKLYAEIEEDTVKKHGFTPYSYNHVLKEFRVFQPDNSLIVKATYQGKVISMAVVVFYGKEVIYHYGASLSEYSKIPASYVIQWEVIKEAKRRGYLKYNFWGISEETLHNGNPHPWKGITLFKKGFGGEEVRYMHPKDIVFSFKGRFQKILEIYRKQKH